MTSTRDPRAAAVLSRRSLLLAAGAGLVSGCTVSSAQPPAPTPPTPSTPATGTGSAGSRAGRTAAPDAASAAPTPDAAPTGAARTLEVPAAYEVLPGEVEPMCKLAAVRFLEAVFTAVEDARDEAGLAGRLAAVGQPAPPAATLADLLPDAGPTALDVTYPQYGGLVLADGLASVMVVADQLLLGGADSPSPDRPTRRTVVVDVLLSRLDGAWVVTDALPGLTGPAAPTVSPAVEAVLADDRIALPDTARRDLLSGAVDDVVALAMTALAAQWRIGVQVLRSGHPGNVFGTDRLSAHTIGRAVDIWSVEDVPVIDRERSGWRPLMEAAVALGAPQVGGPADLGPPGAPYFTDLVHQDHVHVGWRTVGPTG